MSNIQTAGDGLHRTLTRMRPSQKVVAIADVDGVIYDFVTGIGDVASTVLERPRSLFPPANCWNFFMHQWNLTLEQFLDIYRQGVLDYGLCRYGTPLPGSVAGWQHLRDAGVRIHIATDCGVKGAVDEAQAARIEWLADHGFVFNDITFTADKPSVATDYLADGWKVYAIDDRPENYTALANAGCEAFLADQLWNKHLDVPAGRRVLDMHRFAETVIETAAA